MQALVHLPSRLSGTVRVPASKSICNRVLVMSVLAAGRAGMAGVRNLSDCDDTQVMLRALSSGAERADIGAAGTAMRFLTALYAATPGRHRLTGSERMLQRPIGVLVEALRQLGAQVDYAGREGYPPLAIDGRRLAGGEVQLSAGVSSQYISALLMVGPAMERGLRLHLEGEIISRPYIDMTLGLMQAFGAEAGWADGRTLVVRPQAYRGVETFEVENDWSGASYWYEAVALSPDAGARLVLPGLCRDSLQGDAAVRRFFEPLGVRTAFTPGGVVLTKAGSGETVAVTENPVSRPEFSVSRPAETVSHPGKSLAFDLSSQPDLAQTLAVTCAMLGRPFRLSGLRTLRIKETDRIAALQAELAKLGFVVRAEGDDALSWDGQSCKPDAAPSIATYDDHRMALAFAPCAWRFPGLAVQAPGVVSKSYPGYWQEWERLGAQVERMEKGGAA